MTMVIGNDKVRKSTSETLGKDPIQMGELEFNTTKTIELLSNQSKYL